MMAVPRLLLLGQPILTTGTTTTYLRSTKPNLLAWYLAAHPGQLFPRSHLTAVFWEHTPEAAARAALSTTLSRLRQALPVWPLVSEGDLLGWQEHPELPIDLSRFLALSQLPDPDPAALAEAVGLWRGPFLQAAHLPDSQLFEEWLEDQRAYLEGQVLRLFSQLLPLEEQAGAWQALLTHAKQALQINPYNEEFHRSLMRALWQIGDRNGALTHYRNLERLLRVELQVSPHPATRRLRDAILAGEPPEATGLPPAAGASEPLPREGARPLSVTPPLPAAPGPEPPRASTIVGRAEELAQIAEALSQPLPRLVLIRGEAGIGKTSLVNEVMRRQRGQGTVLLGRCYQGFGDLPFAPFLEALTPVIHSAEPSWRRLPDLWLAEVARLLPELAILRPNLQGQTPAVEYRTRLLEALSRFIGCLPAPCLVVLEDLHWADDSTLQLLAYLARQHAQLPVHLLVTMRAEEVPERVNQLRTQLGREGLAHEIALGPLSEAEIRLLVKQRLGTSRWSLATRLYHETRGHPLYATELLAALIESDQLQGRPPRVLPLPPTVQGVIEQRLNRLGPQVVKVLAALAIYPRGAPLTLLEPLLELPPGAVLAGVESAITAGLIKENHNEYGPPYFTFTHAIIRRVVLHSSSRARQQLLHQRAFALLVEQTPQEGFTLAQAKELAHHASAGGLWAEGLTWSQRAAALASELSSHGEASRLLEQALSCSQHVGTRVEQLEREVDLRVKIACIGQFYHRPGRRVQWLAPAYRAARSLGDAERLMAVNLSRAESWILGGHTHTALRGLELLLPKLRREGPARLRCQALYLLGGTYAMQGYNRRAKALFEEQQGYLPSTPSPYRLLMTSFKGYVCTNLGEFDSAEAILEAALAEAHQRRYHHLVANTLVWLARLELTRGNWTKGLARAEASVATAAKLDDPWYRYFASEQRASAIMKLGDAEGCLKAVIESFAFGRRLGTPLFRDRLYSLQAAALIELGNLTGAKLAVAKGKQVADRLGSLYGLALLQQQEARLLALQGDNQGAAALLRATCASLSDLGAGPALARCHAQLAALLGDRPEGNFHWQQATELQSQLGLTEL